MKRKLFCLLTLLLTVFSGAWGAADYTVALSSFTESPSGTYTFNNGSSDIFKGGGKTTWIEVPSVSASGTITIKGSTTDADRKLYVFKTNGTVQDNTRYFTSSTSYPAALNYTSSDILTSDGKYYLVFKSSGDFKGRAIQFTVSGGGGGGSTYTVTYNANGGSGSMADSEGASITLSANTFTAPAGYTFDGWNTAANGSGTAYTAEQSGITTNLALFAQWKQTVILDKNGGTVHGSVVAHYNGTLGAVTAPTYADHTVTGYYNNAEGTTKVLNADGSFAADNVTGYITAGAWTHSGATTLYAKWEESVAPVSDEVTFDLKNASFVVSDPGTTQDGINFQSTLSPGASYLNDGTSSGGHTITISASGSKRISRIVFTFTDAKADRNGEMTASVGTYNDKVNDKPAETGTWTSEFSSGESTVTFTTHNKARVESVVVTYVEVVVVTGNAYNWITFCNGSALDFTGSDVTAYVVTGTSGTALEKTEVGAVAANTPLMINATEGTHYVKKATTGTDYSGTNCLKQGEDAAVDAVVGKSRYILTLRDEKAAFAIIDNEYSPIVPSDKAYLEIGGGGAARSFFFLDDEGETTSLNEVRGLKAEVRGEYFNLNGQRVAQPTKGLYIVNGRKVVIK